MKAILFATNNEDKMREIREILRDLPVPVYSLKDSGISVKVEEDGRTFEENARKKAEGIFRWIAAAGLPALPGHPELRAGDVTVLADDSGLEIDWLGGEPGIYSARYLGENTSYHEKNARLISRLDGVPKEKRTARFVCAVAAVFADGACRTVRGTVEGYIGWEERGEGGFGYDPIFYLYENDLSTAQLAPEVKNEISHRGRALRKMEEFLRGMCAAREGGFCGEKTSSR